MGSYSREAPRVLIVVDGNPDRDPRVLKQLSLLQGHHVTLVCRESSRRLAVDKLLILNHYAHDNVRQQVMAQCLRVFRLALLLLRLHSRYARSTPLFKSGSRALAGSHFDLAIVNDSDPIPLAFEYSNPGSVIVDLHEYGPRYRDNRLMWRLIFQPYYQYLAQHYLPKACAVTTVTQRFQTALMEDYRVSSHLVRNIPPYSAIIAAPVHDNEIRLIYHGSANKSRKLHRLLQIAAHLDERFSLDLMLVGDQREIERLRGLTLRMDNCRVLPAVSHDEVITFSSQYDAGFYILPGDSFNQRHALPNKLFEFIQARLGIIIGNSPAMAEVVKEYGLGVALDVTSMRSMADQINRLTVRDFVSFKNNAELAASELCWEVEAKRLVRVIEACKAPPTP